MRESLWEQLTQDAESGNFVRIRKSVKSGCVQGTDNKGLPCRCLSAAISNLFLRRKLPAIGDACPGIGRKPVPQVPTGGL